MTPASLRAAIAASGLSQSRFAAEIGIGVRQLTNLLNGTHRISPTIAKLVAITWKVAPR